MAAFTKLANLWPRNFRPQPGQFGNLLNTLGAVIGTGGTALTGTASTTVYVGVPAAQRCSVFAAGFQGNTPAVGGSTITAQLVKNPGASAVTLTAATSIKSDVLSSDCIGWPITATGVNRTLNAGDTLAWIVAAATTVTTAPQLVGVVQIAIES